MFRFITFIGLDIIWGWIRPTFQGEDGKASSRKLTVYVVTILFILGNIQVFFVIKDKSLVFDVLLLDATFILILFGIITIQNIITLFKIKSGNNF